RESIEPVGVVAASSLVAHPDVERAWSFAGRASDLLVPSRDDLAIGNLSSGSTGEPKAFFRSQGRQCDQARERVDGWPISVDRDVLGHMSMASFAGGMNAICMGIATGLRIVIGLGEAARGEDLGATLRDHRVTFLSLTPTLLRHLTRTAADGVGFGRVRVLHLSGEPVRATDVGEFHRVSDGSSRLRVSWGSSEAGTLSSGDLEAALARSKGPLPVGHPMPGVEVVAVDEADRPRGPGEPGRLWVRSRNLAVSGDRLAARFRRLGLDEPDRPWFDTGDQGWIAPDGRIVVQGRVDGDLKVNGLRIDGLALENRLSSLAELDEVVAVSIGLERGEALAVAIVPKTRDALDAVAATLAELGSPERRALIEGFEALPLNASRKTDRAAIVEAIRRRATARRHEASARPVTAVESLVADAWQAALDIARPNPDTSLDDLGVDSVARLRLLLELEHRHGLVLPADARATSTTVAAQARNLVPARDGLDAEPIVTLRRSGSAVGCFCPGLGGHAWIFEPLARQLDADIEAIGLDWSRAAGRGSGGLGWLTDRLEERVGDRPLTLLGYSVGAGVAWALAHEWSRRRRTDPAVVVLDGDPMLPRLRRRTWRTRLDHLVSRYRDRGGPADPIETSLAALRRDGLEVISHLRARPGAWPLTLLVTPESDPGRSTHWRRLSRTVRVERIDRRHLDLVRPPLDEILVEAVRTAMRTAT
ncbi:MAG: AMP-binding protein, partial [Planctomycetota bacterium]|nr:AMP-binding protein [Planctomycetota bacterium]